MLKYIILIFISTNVFANTCSDSYMAAQEKNDKISSVLGAISTGGDPVFENSNYNRILAAYMNSPYSQEKNSVYADNGKELSELVKDIAEEARLEKSEELQIKIIKIFTESYENKSLCPVVKYNKNQNPVRKAMKRKHVIRYIAKKLSQNNS